MEPTAYYTIDEVVSCSHDVAVGTLGTEEVGTRENMVFSLVGLLSSVRLANTLLFSR